MGEGAVAKDALVPDGTPAVAKGTMVGVEAGTPVVVMHRSPGGFCNLPRLYWLDLGDHIEWSFGRSESTGYWATDAEFDVTTTPAQPAADTEREPT